MTGSVLTNLVANSAARALILCISVNAAGTCYEGLLVALEVVTESGNKIVSLGCSATGTYVHSVTVGETGCRNDDVLNIVSVELAALSGLHLSYGIVGEVSGLEYGVAITVDNDVGCLNLGNRIILNIPNHYILGVLVTKLVGDTNGHSTAKLRCGSAVNGHSEIVNGIIADSVKNLGVKLEFALILRLSAELYFTRKGILNIRVGNEGSVLKLNVIGILYGFGVNLCLGGFLSGNGGLRQTARTGVKRGNAVRLKHTLAPGMSLGVGVGNVTVKNLVAYRAGVNLNAGYGAGRNGLDAYYYLMLSVLLTASFNSLAASSTGSCTYYLIGTVLTLNGNLGLSPYGKRIGSVAGCVVRLGMVGNFGLLTACVGAGVLNVTVLGTGSRFKLGYAVVVTGSGSYVITALSGAFVRILTGGSRIVSKRGYRLNAFRVTA